MLLLADINDSEHGFGKIRTLSRWSETATFFTMIRINETRCYIPLRTHLPSPTQIWRFQLSVSHIGFSREPHFRLFDKTRSGSFLNIFLSTMLSVISDVFEPAAKSMVQVSSKCSRFASAFPCVKVLFKGKFDCRAK